MVKKVLLLMVALGGLYLGVGFLIRWLASDETKIRWLVEQMEEAYNAGRPGTCVGPLAEDWHHEGYALDRELLLGALFQVSRERDKETRQLRSKVELDEEALRVSVDGRRATLATSATFWRLRAGNWEEAWRLDLEAELVDGDEGWEIMKSRHTDRAGTHLGR